MRPSHLSATPLLSLPLLCPCLLDCSETHQPKKHWQHGRRQDWAGQGRTKAGEGLLDDVGRLTVALSDQLGWLTGIARLELTSRHDDGPNAQLLVSQVALEGLSLTLSSPNTCEAPNPNSGTSKETKLLDLQETGAAMP